MKHINMGTYRELYPETLSDIWNKVAELLTGYGISSHLAEYSALLVAEWIRTNWGGHMQVARHIHEPRSATHDPLSSDRYRQMRDQVARLLADVLPDHSDLHVIAQDIALLVRRDFRVGYIPKVKKLDQLHRDREIWRNFSGSLNIDALVKEHRLSAMRIYQINKEIQKRKDRHDQPLLPGVE